MTVPVVAKYSGRSMETAASIVHTAIPSALLFKKVTAAVLELIANSFARKVISDIESD